MFDLPVSHHACRCTPDPTTKPDPYSLAPSPSPSLSPVALLCRRLSRGLAVGLGSLYATTPRRPRAGLLRLLSSDDHHGRQVAMAATAMEPELALLMAGMLGLSRYEGKEDGSWPLKIRL